MAEIFLASFSPHPSEWGTEEVVVWVWAVCVFVCVCVCVSVFVLFLLFLFLLLSLFCWCFPGAHLRFFIIASKLLQPIDLQHHRTQSEHKRNRNHKTEKARKGHSPDIAKGILWCIQSTTQLMKAWQCFGHFDKQHPMRSVCESMCDVGYIRRDEFSVSHERTKRTTIPQFMHKCNSPIIEMRRKDPIHEHTDNRSYHPSLPLHHSVALRITILLYYFLSTQSHTYHTFTPIHTHSHPFTPIHTHTSKSTVCQNKRDRMEWKEYITPRKRDGIGEEREWLVTGGDFGLVGLQTTSRDHSTISFDCDVSGAVLNTRQCIMIVRKRKAFQYQTAVVPQRHTQQHLTTYRIRHSSSNNNGFTVSNKITQNSRINESPSHHATDNTCTNNNHTNRKIQRERLTIFNTPIFSPSQLFTSNNSFTKLNKITEIRE